MFKRKKKAPTEEVVSESLTLENEEAIAQEIAENVTIFEVSEKHDNSERETPDSPTIRIPNIKDLTEELGAVENAEGLEEILEEAKGLFEDIHSDEEDANNAKTSDKTETNTCEKSTDTESITKGPNNEVRADAINAEGTENTPEEEHESASEDSAEIQAKPSHKKKKAAKLPRKKKKSSFRRKQEWKHGLSLFGNILMWTVSILLFVFCLSNLYQQILNKEEAVGFFGMGNAVVVSESMVPTLEKNDFIVYKSTAIEQLRPEDVVVYKRAVPDGHILIVHRLIAITDGYAITKGDNNSVQDEPFDADNIVGKVILTVPQLGLAMESLSSTFGIIAIIMLFCLLTLSQIIYRKVVYNVWLKKLAQTKEERKAIQLFLEM